MIWHKIQGTSKRTIDEIPDGDVLVRTFKETSGVRFYALKVWTNKEGHKDGMGARFWYDLPPITHYCKITPPKVK